MDGIEKFSWTTNMGKVMAGFGDGPQFKNPNLAPAMMIVNGIDSSVDMKTKMVTPSEGTVIDSWNQRKQSK